MANVSFNGGMEKRIMKRVNIEEAFSKKGITRYMIRFPY